MNKIKYLCFVIGMALSLAHPARAALTVVSTTQDPAAITRAIGGDRVKVSALAKGYQDPHFVDAKPTFMLTLNKADLVIAIGLDLEIGYLPSLITGSRNNKIAIGQPGYLDLSQFVQPLEVVSQADRGQGDVHPLGNPHYWLDPENGRLMARAIAGRLSELDPEGKALYESNLKAFEEELDRRMLDWKKRLEPLAGKPILTFHRSWSYFAARFKLDVKGHVEPKPGIPPTPTHTIAIIKQAKRENIQVLLMENFYDDRVPNLIAQKSPARLVKVPNSVGGDADVKTYFDLFERIIDDLAVGGKE